MESNGTNGTNPEPAKPSTFQVIKNLLNGDISSITHALNASEQPQTTSINADGNTTSAPSEISGLLTDLGSLDLRGVGAVAEAAKLAVTKQPQNDRDFLLERLIKVIAKMPLNSPLSNEASGNLISTLWGELKHPPQSYLGTQWVYRSADGSNNSLLYPRLGAANTPYARTCKPARIQPQVLPDAGVIFDSVMARDGEEDHPGKISSMLFYMASIIIHDVFKTDHSNFGISQTSSYLDLAPLYGSSQEDQNLMRTFQDGKIKPDCFSEKRLLGFPPGVGALLIMFNRFHNKVVENLAAINEGNRFKRPGNDATEKLWKQYDEDLFQTGRLVTGGLYVNIIIHDYLRTILNLHRTDSNWFFDPRQEIDAGVPLGTGNQVSAEFNLIYRWHSCISTKDAKWTEDFYAKIFPGQKPTEMDLHNIVRGLQKLEDDIPEDPGLRGLDDLVRGQDGKFNDDDLVRTLTESIEDVAGAFGARRIPTVMRAVEILGIEQARRWNLASLNELRAYFNLTTYKTFEEMNPDPKIVEQLKHLYDEVDNVELYPGLVVEAAKPMILPGSGFAPNYTLNRAILADAVTLVRSDRFCTIDFHPKQLTNWGFSQASSDPTVENGCVIYKLFYSRFRTTSQGTQSTLITP